MRRKMKLLIFCWKGVCGHKTYVFIVVCILLLSTSGDFKLVASEKK